MSQHPADFNPPNRGACDAAILEEADRLLQLLGSFQYWGISWNPKQAGVDSLCDEEGEPDNDHPFIVGQVLMRKELGEKAVEVADVLRDLLLYARQLAAERDDARDEAIRYRTAAEAYQVEAFNLSAKLLQQDQG